MTEEALVAVDDDGDARQVLIEDSIDLHGFLPRDIPSVVQEYLWEASALGFREVRLIHGRGTGFQRARVRQVVSKHPAVDDFRDAPANRGGWGATVVALLVGAQRDDEPSPQD